MNGQEFEIIVTKDEIRRPGFSDGTVAALWISINKRRIAQALGIGVGDDIRSWKKRDRRR